jgi:hypothetical protein
VEVELCPRPRRCPDRSTAHLRRRRRSRARP